MHACMHACMYVQSETFNTALYNPKAVARNVG